MASAAAVPPDVVGSGDTPETKRVKGETGADPTVVIRAAVESAKGAGAPPAARPASPVRVERRRKVAQSVRKDDVPILSDDEEEMRQRARSTESVRTVAYPAPRSWGPVGPYGRQERRRSLSRPVVDRSARPRPVPEDEFSPPLLPIANDSTVAMSIKAGGGGSRQAPLRRKRGASRGCPAAA